MRGSGRTNEVVDLSYDETLKSCNERWNLENERYKAFYGFDNKDFSVYDFVINNSNLNIEQTAEEILKEYNKFKENKKS